MKNKKSLLSLFITIMTTLMVVCFSFTIINAEENNVRYTLDSGISIDLSQEYSFYAIWNKASEDSLGWQNNNFPSYDTMIEVMSQDGIEFQSRREDGTQDSNNLIYIDEYEAPQSLDNQSLFESFCTRNSNRYIGFEDAPKLGYGVVKINDITFFKIFFETQADNLEKGYAYLLATNDGLIHEIVFWNHGCNDELFYIDSLAYNVMSTISFSNDFISKIMTLDGNDFSMVTGYHTALFKYEITSTHSTINTVAPASTNKTLFQKIISFEFPLWIILVSLFLILLFGVKISSKGEWQQEPLSLENSNAIRGFSAIAIVIHHLCQELFEKTGSAGILSIFTELGVLFVGIFFFFSGYGLYTSLKTKDNYLKGFLKKRLISTLVPFYVCILIFMLFALIKGQTYKLPELITTISGWLLINQHMWYVVEITILYLVFYIVYSLISNRKLATSIIGIFVVVLSIGSLLLGHGADLSSKYWFMGEWWYNTTLCFVLGIVVSQNKEKLEQFSRKFYALLLPIFVALSVAFYFLTNYAINTWSYWSETPGNPHYLDKFKCLGIQLPWVIICVITLLLIMMKVKFGNRVLKFLGGISLELYLIHNLFLVGLHDGSFITIKSASLYILLTVLISIGFATIINGFDNYVVNYLLGKSSYKSQENKRIHSIDVLRIVMAFLVVTIHIPFNNDVGSIFITYGKVAVPFFLTVCGYFLYRNNPQEMMPRLIKQAIRMFVFYILSNIVYAIAVIKLHDFSIASITSKQILDFVLYNMSPFSEHLWFFGSLLYALIILMILNKLKVLNYAMFISPLLLIAYIVLSYLNVATYYALRNAILVTLPYVMIGMLIHRYEDKLLKIKNPILWILALILCASAIAEFYTIKNLDVPFISCEILVYVIVILCLKYPDFGKDTFAEKMGRDLSLIIYVIHILVAMILEKIIPTNTGLISTYGAITTFVVSASIAACYNSLKKLISKNTKEL